MGMLGGKALRPRWVTCESRVRAELAGGAAVIPRREVFVPQGGVERMTNGCIDAVCCSFRFTSFLGGFVLFYFKCL